MFPRIPLALFLAALSFPSLNAVAADLGSGPAPGPEVTTEAEIHAYLARRAVIYEIRHSFDVMSEDEVAVALRADAADALDANGVSGETIAQTEDDLLGEASYFIVSLRYLVSSGFPAWPDDRSAGTYVKDSNAILDPLLGELRSAVEDGGDAAAILESAARVYWWAEGETEPQADKADFTDIEARVDEIADAVADESKGNA